MTNQEFIERYVSHKLGGISQQGNLKVIGDTLYSYETPLAYPYMRDLYIINQTYYSSSSSRHRNKVEFELDQVGKHHLALPEIYCMPKLLVETDRIETFIKDNEQTLQNSNRDLPLLKRKTHLLKIIYEKEKMMQNITSEKKQMNVREFITDVWEHIDHISELAIYTFTKYKDILAYMLRKLQLNNVEMKRWFVSYFHNLLFYLLHQDNLNEYSTTKEIDQVLRDAANYQSLLSDSLLRHFPQYFLNFMQSAVIKAQPVGEITKVFNFRALSYFYEKIADRFGDTVKTPPKSIETKNNIENEDIEWITDN